MPEITQYTFSHKELLTLLIKNQKIHEGIWQLSFNFGFAASNFGPSVADLNPAAIVLIAGVGIQRSTEKTNLSVDAAEINPP